MIIFKIYTLLYKINLLRFNNINIFILYVLLSLFITYPLILQLETSIYGISHDNFGWLTSNFIQLKIWSDNLDPKYVDYLAFPNGIDQTKYIYMYTHEILNTVLLRITNHPIISYNLYFLIKLILAGFCMYLLSYYISNNRYLSFIMGCCYTFSPYFLNMSKAYGGSFITFSLPIVILFIIKSANNLEIKYIIYLILSFIILLGENYYYGYFFFVTVILTIPIYMLIIFFHNKDILSVKAKHIYTLCSKYSIYIISLIITIITYSILLLYHVYPYFNERKFNIIHAQIHSTNLPYYFLPSITNSSYNSIYFIFHKLILDVFISNHQQLYGTYELFERTNYLGYFTVIIFILSIIFTITKKNIHLIISNKYKLIFFALLLSLAMILSFGPDYLLSYPFFKIAPMFRFQSRYFVIVLVSWLCILTIIINLLYLHLKSKYRFIFSVLLFLLFYIEFGEINNGNVINIFEKMPQAYKYIAKDRDPYPIITANAMVSLPYQTNILGFQSFHGKRMVMTPQIPSPNILLPKVQKYYAHKGVKYVIFINKYKNIKTPPLQLPHDELHIINVNILNYPYKNIGYLKLFKKFDDSYIYIFDDSINIGDFEVNINDQTYLFYPGYYNYYEAINMCNYFNMNLIIVTDDNKNELIRKLTPSPKMWLAGERNGEKWKWTSGNYINYFNWSPGEPNNHAIPYGGEDKIVMFPDGTWNDEYHGLFLSAVCEKNNVSKLNPKIIKDSYFFVNKKMNMYNAKIHCAKLGSSLLIIDSIIENQYVKYYFDIQENFWIAGNYDSYRRKWILQNVNEFTNWAPGEPNYDNNIETAIVMRPDGMWNDINQHEKHKFICEFNKDSSSLSQ